MAPCFLKVFSTFATVDAFCPIATYMHITFCPFWFIIVSVAMVVLPVCLSPMMSSLWPRPMGNMESIARIPVCKGVLTDFLSTILGALHSMGRKSSARISPLPSMGVPKASTTLPKKLSPTKTPAILPVLITREPSFKSFSLPNKMHPISSDRIS
ncbi:hypothetical protein SDC9_84325 [bioreactor metagenome]|uniref:Uncharacterized protein n=1 Tax=bioreactor metagenome TaxID=1076179 RepID=A0A644Z9Z9_9ZZZZ